MRFLAVLTHFTAFSGRKCSVFYLLNAWKDAVWDNYCLSTTIIQSSNKMETIQNKTGWLRQLRPDKVMLGRLSSRNECRSMSSIILRWNKTEGLMQKQEMKYKIDYDDLVVAVWLVGVKGKEVRHVK